jgi:hypothetical protein
MSQMTKADKSRFPKAFQFLSSDLRELSTTAPRTWSAFIQHSHLSPQQAIDAVRMDIGPPLIFADDLGPAVWGMFNPRIPGRIQINMNVLDEFESAVDLTVAAEFLRAKVLHEMCHWGCFKAGVPDNDQAGEEFEADAFGRELQPWWLGPRTPQREQPAPAMATSDVSPFISPVARAELLGSLLTSHRQAPGRESDPDRRVFAGVDVAQGLPRGYRNNNPGNIRIGSRWLGLADPEQMSKFPFQQRESAFCVFCEPEWGLRAICSLMGRYKTDYGLDTPRKIISRWAPASDNNDVESYSAQIAAALNIDRDGIVDVANDEVLIALIRAIARHENGDTPPYADVQFRTALLLLRQS